MSRRRILAEDLYELKVLMDCQISPNGEKIVYTLQTVDKENEKKFTHLWILSIDDGKPVQLSFGKHNNIHPKWSPDGQWIAFLSDREGKNQTQLYVLPLTGGEGRPLTDFHGDYGDFDWSPDSKKIVFQFRQHDQEDVDILLDEKKKELGRVARRIDNRIFYKLDAYGYLPKARHHLWTVDIHTSELEQLTDSETHDETGPVWSPDGNQIAFFTNRSDKPDLHPDKIDLFLLNLETGETERIPTSDGAKSKASFSPDGKHLAYFGRSGLKLDYKNTEIWVFDLEKRDEARSLTAHFDFNVGGGVINDTGSAITSPPIWSADNQNIYFQVGRHGLTGLHKIDIKGNNLETINKFEGVVSGFSMDEEEKRIAYIHGTLTDPCQVAYFDVKDPEPTLLTTINRDLLDNIDLGTVEEVWFKGASGNDLQGWILKPPDFNPARKYPSIMEIHGGPLAQYGFFFMHEFYFLAAHDYVVYFCNPRGGQGYGEEHAKAIYYGKWGTVDYDDLMKWADYVQQLPYIDPKNMGVTGGSYGGYMTVWIIGHTDRFKAAVSQRCVSNLISMWGSSDFNWSFQEIFDDKAPYENMEILWECSPIKHIGNAKTPTLIIHSMQDLRCAIEQSEQVYVALQKQGVETAFLIFPDSPHGLSRTGRTDRKIVRLNGILDWFERYLKTE